MATEVNGAAELPQATIDEFVGVSHGDFARVKELLDEYPALLNAVATWQETAIEAATQLGRRDIAELLLDAGAPLEICTAAVFGMSDKVDELLAADPNAAQATGAHGIPLLYFPVIGGYGEIAKRVLAAGAPINAGEGGTTPLHGAAVFGKADLAEWLLSAGAAPNPLNYEGKTPLRVALDRGHADVAAVIRRHRGIE